MFARQGRALYYDLVELLTDVLNCDPLHLMTCFVKDNSCYIIYVGNACPLGRVGAPHVIFCIDT